MSCEGEAKDTLYIGETTRLFRRFGEHMAGRGASNTECFDRERTDSVKLVGLYRMDNNKTYYSTDNHLLVENRLTEWCMWHFSEFEGTIRGGKYTRQTCNHRAVAGTLAEPRRPACHCGYPAEIIKTKSGHTAFVCATSNAEYMAENGIEYSHPYFTYEVACTFFSFSPE